MHHFIKTALFSRTQVFLQIAKNTPLSIVRYILLLYITTYVVILYFLSFAPLPVGAREWFYWLGLPSYYFFVLVMVGLFCLPIVLVPGLKWLVPMMGGIWLVLLAADIIVFTAYKFHINLFFIQMFFLDFKGLGLPGILMMYAAISAGLLFLLSFGVWRWALRINTWLKSWRLWGIFFFLVSMFCVNQSVHAWASYFYRTEITRYSAYLPFYFPVQDPKGATWLSHVMPTVFPAVDGQSVTSSSKYKNLIHYPLSQPDCHSEKLPNIVMVVIESWQADTLNKAVMPFTSQLASTAWHFQNHISGGNATIPGVFSLMTGLHASYYDAFKSQPADNKSFFTESLYRSGYQSKVFTNSSFENFGLKPLLFSRVSADNYFSPKEIDPDKGDIQIFYAWLNSLSQPNNQPRFDFLFFSASHYPYDYPIENKKFMPVSDDKSAHLLRRDMDTRPLKNDYLNSLNFIDGLLSKVVNSLTQRQDWENTWLLVVGDHGEEFNENGLKYWGHASNFSQWQTHVPLIVKPPAPFQAKQFKQYSTHQDIVPSLMTYALGCHPEDINQYANGLLLDHLPEKRSTVLGSYVSSAYWINGDVQDKLFGGLNYDWLDMKNKRPEINKKAVLELMDQEARFFAH